MSHLKLSAALLSALLYIFLLCLPQASAERIVRVGWYDFGTLSAYTPSADPRSTSTDEDLPGVYSGYNYEYLRMISQINGWQLHFVPGTLNESLARLEAGEVDLVGGIGKIPAREAKFAFPVNSVLRATIGLIARADDDRFALNDFASIRGIRVGAVADSNPLFRLQEWSRQRSIPLQYITYPSFEAMYAALDTGEVDAVTDSLLVPRPNRKILANIESLGIYFVGNKRDPQLIQELDDAISQIQYLKPGYQETLSSKYLYAQAYSSFVLSHREQAYLDTRIASGIPIRVSFAASWYPIAYIDPDSGEIRGIMADLFTRIAELTGLSFEYVPLSAPYAEPSSAEIQASISSDFSWADRQNVYLSQTVFESPIFMITHAEPTGTARVALMADSHLAETVKNRLTEDSAMEYIYYNTAPACMEAVQDGRADRTYINAYELNYYMNQNKFSQLTFQPIPGFTEAISIGVSKDSDPLLCSIICQALRSISPTEMSNIILKNTTFRPEHSLRAFVYSNPLGSLLGAALLALLFGGTLFFYYSNRKNERLRAQLQDILQSRASLLQANEELNHMSQYDALTGIPNRRGLDDFLQRVYPDSQQAVLAMMDLDEFKKYNDTYGHIAGDEALRRVARILRQHAIDTGSFTARFGGEEFIWVDTLRPAEEAQDILESLRQKLFDANIFHSTTAAKRLTISIGCAVKEADESFDAILQRADEALYQAKHEGRNNIKCAKNK